MNRPPARRLSFANSTSPAFCFAGSALALDLNLVTDRALSPSWPQMPVPAAAMVEDWTRPNSAQGAIVSQNPLRGPDEKPVQKADN